VETERGYKAWGEQRYGSAGVTSFGFTGQRDSSVAGGIMYYGARWYDESLGRFIQPDTIVPEPYNPLAYDRYQYVYSNPVRYTDSSGHCIDGVTTWACLVFLGGLILKAIDYGWTAYDTYQSGTVLADPGASREDKLLAGLNVGLAIIFEAGEPDDLLPVGLPVDDLGRRAIMKGAKEAFEEGGEEALEKFIRENLGDYADDVLKKMGLVDDYKVLQTGGHTLTKDTLAGLKLTQNEAHLALNRFKQHYHLRNDFHGIIMNNGDILDPNTRKVIGNLYEFVP
jgi:RHS repeat-associated protein